MSSIVAFVEVLHKIASTRGLIANIGRPQLIKQIDAIRVNLEQFKKAAEKDDKSAMRVLLAECEALSEALEKRLFQGLDEETSNSLETTIRGARAAKGGILRTTEPAPTPQKIRRAAKEKSAELEKTISSSERGRQKLIAELDTAIGRLRGISKSLSAGI